jgi:hypothetical protein
MAGSDELPQMAKIAEIAALQFWQLQIFATLALIPIPTQTPARERNFCP